MANCKSQIWNFEQGSRIREATGRKGRKRHKAEGNRERDEGCRKGKRAASTVICKLDAVISGMPRGS